MTSPRRSACQMVLLLFALGSHLAFSQEQLILLAIFAHPDDEASVSPILAKYAREGVQVHLAVAADGRYGYQEFAAIPKGDSLVRVREGELKCACSKLGLEEPITFGLHDQLRSGDGWDQFKDQLAEMRSRVSQLFEELKPDVVVTWGPDGFTGHPDHRLVGAVVTEVFASRDWIKPVNLFQVGLPRSKFPADGPIQLTTLEDHILTVQVPYETRDGEVARQAWRCHRSQYQPETIEMLSNLIRQAIGQMVYFRPYYPTEVRNSLFD